MENSSTKVKTTPLLSPVTESKLLQEIWLSAKDSPNSVFTESTAASWEEKYQDLSVYCEDQPSGNWSQIQRPFRRQQDCRTGEQDTSKISNLRYNNNYSSYKDSGLEDSSETGENWTASNNIDSAVMSCGGSLPIGQDQFNTVTDITSDDLFSFLTTTNTNEQPVDSLQSIPNSNSYIPDSNLYEIYNIEPEFLDNFTLDAQDPNIIQFDDSITKDLCDESYMIPNNEQSLSTNATDERYKQENLPTEEPLENFTEIDSFDIISYMQEINREPPKKESNADKGEFIPSEVIVPSEVLINNNRRPYRKRKSSEITTPENKLYVPPLKINIKTKVVSPLKKKSFQLSSEESNSYIDSDSETRTSDYNYRELRGKNNEASRKSRFNKKVKETEMMKQEKELEKENRSLKVRVERLEGLVNSMRTLMLQSVLKKEPQ